MVANTTDKFCSVCGNGLEPSGECNACLLQLGISQAGENNFPDTAALPSLEELNAQFPQLEITRLVGNGGMGAIYHARQTALDRDVALKLIRKEVSSDAAFVERFEREAKTLAKLSHPHIVTIFDFGRTSDGIAYLIMEYVDGINLREAIESSSIGSDEALEVVSTICGALKYAHSKGIVHRDIKPENILLGEDGTLKVVDFGIAKIIDESVRTPTLTATRQVLGSLHYLAPEHLESPDEVDHRVDLYALGVVFYELLTGQLPLGRYEPPSSVHGSVDPRLDQIVLKTLSRKPGQRYQDADELDSDLDEIRTTNAKLPPEGAVNAELIHPSTVGRSVSVPFTCEVMGGFAEAVGMVHARRNMLCVEFRIRDSICGQVKSNTHLVEIPRGNLTRLEYVPGVLRAKLVVAADTIAALGALPNAETGRVELTISRKDDAFARKVIHALGFGASTMAQSVAEPPARTTWPTRASESRRLVLALLMIFCGIFNAGGLGILEFILADSLDGIALVACCVGAAIVIGPIALIQMITGLLNLIGRPDSLNLATAVISMIPVTPAWLLSCPAGIWAYRWLTRKPSITTKTRESFGTTTLMFIRESRWARILGVVNAVGVILILAALAVFKLGYYPAELSYRVVDKSVPYGALRTAIQNRLDLSSGIGSFDHDELGRPTRLTIKSWQRFRRRVENQLSVQEVPQLVWLSAKEKGALPAEFFHGDEESARLAIPVVSGLSIRQLRNGNDRLGPTVMAVGEPFQLCSEFVAKVAAGKLDGAQLVVELTASGREDLEVRLISKESTAGLGLVIGGLVEGIAPMESISPKQVTFQLSTASDLTAEGITAGIRGPNIPSALELLD